MMRDTFVNLAVILCCLLTTSIFAEYNIELQPVLSESHQHTGYSAKMISDREQKEFNLLLDMLSPFTWVPRYPDYDPDLSNSEPCVHEFCANKQHYERECSNYYYIFEHGSIYVCADIIEDNISFPCMENGPSLAWSGVPLGLFRILRWNNWKDYQGIDGVLGLAALHIDQRPLSKSRGMYTDWNVYYNLFTRTMYDGNFKWPIAIALPPLNSGKKAVLTVGGVYNELCNMSQATAEPLLVYSKSLDDHSSNQYEFKYDDIIMGNTTFSSYYYNEIAYLHTTQPFITVPEEFLQEIAAKYNAQNESNTYLVDCNIQLEPFVMVTFHAKYTIPAEYLLIKKNEGDTQCVLLLKSAKTVALGLPFLHAYCAVLDKNKIILKIPSPTVERHIKTPSQLKRHSDERPCKCEVFKQRFGFPIRLKDRITIRTGKKPYQCEFVNSDVQVL
ncbi:Eukaryotic aspartyl protease family protein [Acanthocheilonema viteae]